METTAKVGLSGAGVIRYHGKAASIQVPSICWSTHHHQVGREQLKQQIFSRHKEYLHIEKENKLLSEKVEKLDVLLKQQDYDVTCLKYELEKVDLEKRKLEASLRANQKPVKMATQPEVIYIPPRTEFTPGQAKKSYLTTPRHLKHEVDLQKEPQIYCACGVQFTTKQNLREHIKYYTFGMNFLCPTCGIRKHGLNQLRTHMKVTHSVSTTYLASLKGCRVCGRLFTSLGDLHEHRRNEHGRVRI